MVLFSDSIVILEVFEEIEERTIDADPGGFVEGYVGEQKRE